MTAVIDHEQQSSDKTKPMTEIENGLFENNEKINAREKFFGKIINGAV